MSEFAPLVGSSFRQSPVVYVECTKKHRTLVHQDATRWYCTGCKVVHRLPGTP